jgi:23S rRNA (cytosine1962-C5)-methyltransferase
MDAQPKLVLKRREEKRLRAGHLWIFSNEVDTHRSPMTSFDELGPGRAVDVIDHDGKALGSALVNPHSLICARLISRKAGVTPSPKWFRKRIERALQLRELRDDGRCYRMVYSESDGLPGLIIDRFGDVLVGQLNTAGMDALRPVIEQVLMDLLEPVGILWRNDSQIRELEGLAREVVQGPGSIPESVQVVEGELRFELALNEGQKTGWYFDQRANRERVAPLLGRCGRVLDLYAYQGAWGIAAARAGAESVLCVDSSQPAVDAIPRHAEANGVDDRVNAIQANAERYMDTLLEEKARFDAVIVDPPAFAPRARDVQQALKAYRRLNEKALRLLEPGGLLVTMTCSAHIHEERYEALLLQAARHIDRDLQVLMRLEQGPDHPVHPAIPESRYLKGRVVRVLPTF